MADTEKITINMNVVEMGQIDLLVQEGFYSNRTDFIRTAIRNQLNTHGDAVKQTMQRRAMAIGVLIYNRKDLEKLDAEGASLSIKVVGMAVLSDDIPPDLARKVIQSLEVYGVLKATPEVRSALQDRMKN